MIATFVVGSIRQTAVEASTAIGATGVVIQRYPNQDIVLSLDPGLLRASGADEQVELYGVQIVDGAAFPRANPVWIGTIAKSCDPRIGDRVEVDLDAPHRVPRIVTRAVRS